MAVKDDPFYAAKAMPHHAHRHVVNKIHHDQASFGEKLADKIAAGIGSWTFLIVQTFAVLCWVSANVIGWWRHWDVYPFVLLNLLFSVQAAYTGPVLLLAGNRQAQKDRLTLEHAAAEADKTEDRTLMILKEIQHNTEITVEVLNRLESQQETLADSSRRMVELHEQLLQRKLSGRPLTPPT